MLLNLSKNSKNAPKTVELVMFWTFNLTISIGRSSIYKNIKYMKEIK